MFTYKKQFGCNKTYRPSSHVTVKINRPLHPAVKLARLAHHHHWTLARRSQLGNIIYNLLHLALKRLSQFIYDIINILRRPERVLLQDSLDLVVDTQHTTLARGACHRSEDFTSYLAKHCRLAVEVLQPSERASHPLCLARKTAV